MTTRSIWRVFACLLILTVFVSGAWSQTPTVEPQTLVGKWSGSWTNANTGKGNGKYYLSIDRVEGQQVLGSGEFIGQKTTQFKVNGTLSGNQLTFGRTELTVDGVTMRGKAPNIDIKLMKEQ
jgi:hypothetical protein